MAPEKFVLRLLDASAQLLGWAEVYADPRPQERGGSCPFWPSQDALIPIDVSGVATEITVHWCALDVARRAPIPEPVPVEAGTVMRWAWLQPVWLVPGARDVPLPAVTLRGPARVVVPVGSLNGVSV